MPPRTRVRRGGNHHHFTTLHTSYTENQGTDQALRCRARYAFACRSLVPSVRSNIAFWRDHSPPLARNRTSHIHTHCTLPRLDEDMTKFSNFSSQFGDCTCIITLFALAFQEAWEGLRCCFSVLLSHAHTLSPLALPLSSHTTLHCIFPVHREEGVRDAR